MDRKSPLITGEVYHIFNKSIAGFKIFNNDSDGLRMVALLKYYQIKQPDVKFSYFMRLNRKEGLRSLQRQNTDNSCAVAIIAYCVMPTHLHLILKQLEDRGISIFMNNILNSYSRFFNTKYNRKGPLWEGRFKNVLVRTDEQLLHLTRYIHLNPVTANLVDSPHLWHVSSYNEYLSNLNNEDKFCSYKDVIDMEPHTYKNFVLDRVAYQRELKEIKDLIFE